MKAAASFSTLSLGSLDTPPGDFFFGLYADTAEWEVGRANRTEPNAVMKRAQGAGFLHGLSLHLPMQARLFLRTLCKRNRMGRNLGKRERI
jgi:hypothetical protein